MSKRFLIDTNVVLDLLLAREPFVADAVHIFTLAESKQIELYLSTDAISTVFYIVSRNKGRAAARQAVLNTLDFVSLAALDEACVLDGLALYMPDMEDALVAAVAHRVDADAIITRNAKDFKASLVPAVSPREAIALVGAGG
ncbi:MAG: PIN domain-containing protein [Coriobacteriia bacterium]|nr:PIN domain-containing protein [Coriobacteriia bacterium]